MNIALIIFASLLAFAAIGSAISKLVKVPDVMTAMASVGVKPNQVPVLAILEIAGGLGLIAGIWNQKLGLAATVGLVLYFAGALIAHLKKKHKVADFAAALGIFIIAGITTYLQLQRQLFKEHSSLASGTELLLIAPTPRASQLSMQSSWALLSCRARMTGA